MKEAERHVSLHAAAQPVRAEGNATTGLSLDLDLGSELFLVSSGAT